MRAAASQLMTQSGPLGASRPTRLPLPTPVARSPLASCADRCSTSAYVRRWSSSTTNVLSPWRSAHHRMSSPAVGRNSGKLVERSVTTGCGGGAAVASGHLHEAGQVAAHDFGDLVVGEPGEVVDE